MKRHQVFLKAALWSTLLWFDPAAQAQPADAVFSATLMKDGIDAYSQAGTRGDQQAADALLDEDVLFAGGDGAVQRDDKRDRSDAVAALLQEQTVAWRRAASMGKLAAMRRYFLRDLLAIDENGNVTEGAQYRPAADLPLPGAPVQDTVSDWVVHHDGKTAVASYVEERTLRYGGQALHFRSLVIDTWIAQHDGWKLFATHATPLFYDPAAVQVPGSELDTYIGDYAIGAGAKVRISRDGDALLSSVNGGKPTRYAAEWRDVFYATGMSPGSARAHLYFQRDATGHVTGYLSSSGLTLRRDEDGAAGANAGAAMQSVESTVLPAAHLVVHRQGDVAVATFIHERITHFYGLTLHTQYRSTETWVKRGETWKMLALQSRALEQEMPVRDLAKDEMGDYAGSYAAGAGLAGEISWHQGELQLHTAGAAPYPLRPIVRDDFASPGSPGTGTLFQRNQDGRVAGFVLRCQGQDLLFVKLRPYRNIKA